MGTINTKFFDDLANKATWSAGVAFKRSNPLPIDKYSVFETIALAEEYARTSAVAYPGQVIAAVDTDNNQMAVYVLAEVADTVEEGAEQTYHLELQELGGKVDLDEKSLAYNEETGLLEISGFKAADGLTLPQKQADGSIKWVGIDAIVEGDGNTTYKFALNTNKTGFTVTPVDAGEEGEPVEITLDVYTKSEIDDKFAAVADEIGVASKPESSEGADDAVAATGLHKKIEDEAARATAAEKALDAKIGTAATDDEEATGVYAYVDNQIDGLEDTISKLNHFTTKIVDSEAEVTETGILYLIKDEEVAGVDKYNEYLYIESEGAVLIGDTTTDLSDYYTKDEVDGAIKTVQDAVDALEAIDNATQEELDTYKQEVADALEFKANTADVYAKSEVYTKSETDNKIDEKIASVTGGESAADVKLALESYRDALNAEIWGDDAKGWTTTGEDGKIVYNPQYGTDSRLDKLEAVGAQANVIESVVAADEAKITATKVGKEVTIDDSALVALIAAAQSKAEQGVADAADAAVVASTAQATANANKTNLEELTGRVTTAEGKINDNASAIAAHATEFATLKGRVDAHDTIIADKADSSTVTALSEALGTTNGNVTALTERVAANETAISNKADASKVYTKDEIGTITKDKTLVDMINEAKSEASYDDTAIKALIQGNTDAINDLSDVVNDKANKGTTLADYGITNAYTKTESDIAIAEAVAASQHLKKQIVDSVNENGQPILNGEVIAIDANTIYMVAVSSTIGEDKYKEYMQVGDRLVLIGDTSIDLTGYVTEDITDDLADRIKALEDVGSQANVIEAITLAGTAATITNKTVDIPAATAEALGLAQADGTSIGVTKGVFSVKAVSTDLLVQGENELVLMGGGAAD